MERILNVANGKYECCRNEAPFAGLMAVRTLKFVTPIDWRVAERTRASNAIALCPNCRRELHFGINRSDLLSSVYGRIQRLVAE